MKKMITTLMIAVFVMIAGSAFAGPVDWAAEKLGYVPEAQLVAAQVETAKAIAAAKEATTAAKEAADIAGKATTYGIFMTALLGGLAIFRKKISKRILTEKPKKADPKEV
jgi:Na+/glutamate symporter